MKKFGNLKKKILLISLFFSIEEGYSLEFKKESIIIPKTLFMVREDVKNVVKSGYKYNVEYKKYKEPRLIQFKNNNKNDTPEKLLASLFYSYKNQDKSLMISLFDKESQHVIKNLSKDKYQAQMDVLKIITKPAINYAFKYQGGIVVSWKDPIFKQARQIFLKKEKENYIISSFKANKEDKYFWNVNIYMAGAPFEIFTPQILKSFKKIKNGKEDVLSFKLQRPGNYLHLFREDDKKINLSLRDNYEQKSSPLQDTNSELKKVDINLKGEHFSKSGKNTLYYLESSYPMTRITDEGLIKAKKIIVIKE